MRLRGKETKRFEIQKIYIDRRIDRTIVSFVINGQYVEMYTKGVYVDSIFDEITSYLKEVSDDSNVYYKLR